MGTMKRAQLQLESPSASRKRRAGEWVPLAETRRFVERLVACNAKRAHIAAMVINDLTKQPISIELLEKLFARELELGLVKANLAVADSCFKQAVGTPDLVDEDGHFVAKGTPPVPIMTIWWEKTRTGMREGISSDDQSGGEVGQTPHVVIILPRNGREADAVEIERESKAKPAKGKDSAGVASGGKGRAGTKGK